jgi:exodeoxyribonuclease-5
MTALQQKVVLLAPTGRAAKVFSGYAGHPAYTIHKKIYRQQSFSNEVSNFVVNDNLNTQTLFIVDESSMIANEGLSGLCRHGAFTRYLIQLFIQACNAAYC